MTKFRNLCTAVFWWVVTIAAIANVFYCFYQVFHTLGFMIGSNILIVLLLTLFVGYNAHKRMWDGSFASLIGWLKQGEEVTIKSIDPHMIGIDQTRLYMIVQRADGTRLACHAMDADFDGPIRIGWRYRLKGERLEGARRFPRFPR